MKIKAGSNLTKVKQTNDISILGMIYQNGPVSRGEVARQLEITLPTVTTTVKRLLEQGIVRETEMKEQDFSLGRKAMAVDIAPDSCYVVGMEWSPFGPVCCITDLRGNMVIKRRRLEGDLCLDYEQQMSLTRKYVKDMLEESGISREKLSGAGWVTPGMVDKENGILVCSSMNGANWRRKRVREILRNGVRYMGISIANIINLVNSPLVVIDSAVTTLLEMQKYLDEVIQENNYFKEELEVEIDYIAASRYTGALGACAVAVKELFIRRP